MLFLRTLPSSNVEHEAVSSCQVVVISSLQPSERHQKKLTKHEDISSTRVMTWHVASVSLRNLSPASSGSLGNIVEASFCNMVLEAANKKNGKERSSDLFTKRALSEFEVNGANSYLDPYIIHNKRDASIFFGISWLSSVCLMWCGEKAKPQILTLKLSNKTKTTNETFKLDFVLDEGRYGFKSLLHFHFVWLLTVGSCLQTLKFHKIRSTDLNEIHNLT
ncbi:CLUMA_CG020027, isoform A [Clunio marinus]|uniref:CLUMA_CG020027, isoform A n=1 Tax=Clunio marinus TaxID=568069 RepID=A0A1J1J3M0_9DIPT|nr:CLUMA_CG020027, isoform A [Clunio marinus]